MNPKSVGFDQFVNKLTEESGQDENHWASTAWTPMPFDTTDPNAIAPLSNAPLTFGYGGLLRDGAGEADLDEVAATFSEHANLIPEEAEGAGKSLKDRYIVRVGWDDTRGWLGEGGTLIGSSRCPSCEYTEAFQLSGMADL